MGGALDHLSLKYWFFPRRARAITIKISTAILGYDITYSIWHILLPVVRKRPRAYEHLKKKRLLRRTIAIIIPVPSSLCCVPSTEPYVGRHWSKCKGVEPF